MWQVHPVQRHYPGENRGEDLYSPSRVTAPARPRGSLLPYPSTIVLVSRLLDHLTDRQLVTIKGVQQCQRQIGQGLHEQVKVQFRWPPLDEHPQGGVSQIDEIPIAVTHLGQAEQGATNRAGQQGGAGPARVTADLQPATARPSTPAVTSRPSRPPSSACIRPRCPWTPPAKTESGGATAGRPP